MTANESFSLEFWILNLSMLPVAARQCFNVSKHNFQFFFSLTFSFRAIPNSDEVLKILMDVMVQNCMLSNPNINQKSSSTNQSLNYVRVSKETLFDGGGMFKNTFRDCEFFRLFHFLLFFFFLINDRFQTRE